MEPPLQIVRGETVALLDDVRARQIGRRLRQRPRVPTLGKATDRFAHQSLHLAARHIADHHQHHARTHHLRGLILLEIGHAELLERLLGACRFERIRMARVGDAVGEIIQKRVGRVLPLRHRLHELLAHELHLCRLEARRHQPIGEDGPGAVEPRGRGAQPHRGPVHAGTHGNRAAESRHLGAQHVTRILGGATLTRFEEQQLGSLSLLGELTGAAQQIQIRGDDVVGRHLPQNDRDAAHGELHRERVVAHDGRRQRFGRRGGSRPRLRGGSRRRSRGDLRVECAGQRGEQRHGTACVSCAHGRTPALIGVSSSFSDSPSARRACAESSTFVTRGLPAMYVDV